MSTQNTPGLQSLASGTWRTDWTLVNSFECNGKIYWFWYRADGEYDIDLLNPDGSGYTKLTEGNLPTGYNVLSVFVAEAGYPVVVMYDNNSGNYEYFKILID